MHFANRQDFIQWATVTIFAAQNFKTDTQAKENALRHAQELADLFFPRNETAQGRDHDVYSDAPEVKAPPQVRTVNPPVPGQRATVPGQE
jgi:hypothetical protein